MKVLLMSVSTGQGHHQAAKAAVAALHKKGVQCGTLDVYEYISPTYNDSLSKGYLISTKISPKEYGRMYRWAEKNYSFTSPFSLGKLFNVILSRKLTDFLNEYKPDVIVCTHVLSAHLVTVLQRKGYLKGVKVVGIVTDFTLHPFWEDTEIDYYVTPSHLMNLQLEKRGVPVSKAVPIGIPVGEQFAKKLDKAEARRRLGIENKDTVLVMSGSMGYGNLSGLIEKIDNVPLDFQILCVCGNNTRAKRKIDRMTTRKKVYNFGYVNNVPEMMDAADCIVTKPGGLTSSEALAKGLFMVLINPIPGQEDRNSEFLVNNGAALRVTKTVPLDEAVYQVLANTWRRNQADSMIGYLGRPNAASDFAEFILGLKP